MSSLEGRAALLEARASALEERQKKVKEAILWIATHTWFFRRPKYHPLPGDKIGDDLDWNGL